MKSHHQGSLSTIIIIDFILNELAKANKAELLHDGSLPYRLFDWNQTAARYTKKYVIFLKSGPRDLIPRAIVTLTFDHRTSMGSLTATAKDLTEIKNRIPTLATAVQSLNHSTHSNHSNETTEIRKETHAYANHHSAPAIHHAP